jgi:signal transduction histidine kinase
MSQWEDDYEILSGVIHAWLGGILGFYALLIGWIIFAIAAGFVGASFVEHPVASALVVVGVIWFLSARYSWASVWEWIRFVLIILVAFGLFVVGMILSPYLTIAAAAGMVIWGIMRENRNNAAQAAAEEAARREQAERIRRQGEGDGDHDSGTATP